MRFRLDAFGQMWGMRRPLVGSQGASSFIAGIPEARSPVDFYSGFLLIHAEEPAHMSAAMGDEPGLDDEILSELADGIVAVAYDGLPLRAVLTLLSMWSDRSQLTHGQLLAAGNPSGASGLDLFDACCLMWAHLDDLVAATQFTARDLKKSAKLHDDLVGMQGRSGDAQGEVEALRALMERQVAQEPEDAPTSSTTQEDEHG